MDADVAHDYSWEALERAEQAMAAEEAAQVAYEERCRARQQAEEDWVDAVVGEQEALAASRAAAAPVARPPSAPAGDPSSSHDRWSEVVTPLGLCVSCEGQADGGG
eukprot:4974905-Prymnesium_polylepis.1